MALPPGLSPKAAFYERVAFCGPAGAGKSTAASILMEHHGFTHLSFAAPIKQALSVLTGLPHAAFLDPALKQQPIAWLDGKTPRYLMQTLGTEWGRDLVHPDLWTRALENRLQNFHPAQPLVVDDARFENEVEMLKANRFLVVRIVRVDSVKDRSHPSESHALTLPAAVEIVNDGGIEDLHVKLKEALCPT